MGALEAWFHLFMLNRGVLLTPFLVHYEAAGEAARLSLRTSEHYLPLLYPAAMRAPGDAVSFPRVGIDLASMSMRRIRFGQKAA